MLSCFATLTAWLSHLLCLLFLGRAGVSLHYNGLPYWTIPLGTILIKSVNMRDIALFYCSGLVRSSRFLSLFQGIHLRTFLFVWLIDIIFFSKLILNRGVPLR